MEPRELIFLFLAIVSVLSAAVVTFSNKLIHSAFALMATLLGFAGFYVMLGADFLAVTQVIIYVGGILILILFGVLMTHKIYDTARKTAHNPLITALIGGVAVAFILSLVIFASPWAPAVQKAFVPTTATIGMSILSTYLLPFEIVSVLLLGALIGAVYLARTEDIKK